MKGWLLAVLVVGAALYYFVVRAKPDGPNPPPLAASTDQTSEPAVARPITQAEAEGHETPELQSASPVVLAAAAVANGAGEATLTAPPGVDHAAAQQMVADLEHGIQAQSAGVQERLAAALAERQLPPEVRARVAVLIDRVAKGDLERRRMLSLVLDAGPFPGEDLAYQRLTEINQGLIFSRSSTYAARIPYRVQNGDSLWRIIKRLQKEHPGLRITPEFVQRSNELASDRLKAGMALSIPSETMQIKVSKARYQLSLFLGDVLLRRYPVCLGKDNKTPSGTFQINSRVENPPWIRPGKSIPFGDKENVLGTRWLGFQKSDQADGLGIHGTWEPETIGKSLSLGCVRLRNEDVEDLFALVPEGTVVTIE